MDLLRSMGDDQLALLGCAGVLLIAFTVMAVSYHVGRVVRGSSVRTTAAPPSRTGAASPSDASRRRAA